ARDALAGPAASEIFTKELRYGRIFNPQHHVVPRGIMLAEVNAADVCDTVVDNDQLLMTPGQKSTRRSAKMIAILDLYAPVIELGMKVPCRRSFRTEILVEPISRLVQALIAEHDSRNRIHQNSLVTRRRFDQRVSQQASH